MIPAIGDTLDGRYTLIAQYRTQPGLSAWIAHDYALDEDCQIFLLTDSTRIGVVSQIASALVLSHNPRSTAVRRFHTVGGALLVVMEPDHGTALSMLTDTKDPQNRLSFTAMRMVTNELIDTIQSLHASQVDFHTLTPEVVRLTDHSLVLSAVPLDPYIEPPLVTRARQTSTAPEMLAILQIAAILFQMMTGVTFDPRDMETMDRELLEARHSAQLRGTDLPVDFLTILERALGVRMTEGRSDDRLFPIYTLMEMQALLDDPRRPGDLGPDDLTVPQSAGTSSVALAHLLPSDQQDLVDIPDSLVSTDTVHNEAGVIAPWSRQELFTGTDVQEIDPAAGGLFEPDADASDENNDGNNDLGHDNVSGTSRTDLADMLNGEVGSEDGLIGAGTPDTPSGSASGGQSLGAPENSGSPASAPSSSAPAGNTAGAGSAGSSARARTSVSASQTGAAGTADIDDTTVFAPLDARRREGRRPDQARPHGVDGAADGSGTRSSATGADSSSAHPVRRADASGPDDRAAAASASFSEAIQEQRAERSAHTQTIVDHHELSDADSARFDEKERKERTKKENPHRLAQGIVIAVVAAAVIAVGAVAIHELHGTGAISLPWSQQEKDSDIGKKWNIDVSKAPLPGSAKQEQQEQQEDADDQAQGSGSSASNSSSSSSKSSKKSAGSTKQKTGSTTGRKQAKSAGTGSASLLKGTKNASAVPKPVEPVTNPVRLAFTQRFFSTSDGRGIAISLTGKHRVSQVSVTLQSQTSAGTGKIYIDSTASDPRHGSPVATFTFAGGNQPTTITLPGNPSTQNLVVWVDQAPTNGFYYSNLSVLGQ